MVAGAVLGIDPGVNGGLAVLDELGAVLYVKAFHPTMTRTELRDYLHAAAATVGPDGHAYLEKVNTRPGEGHVGAFTFGRIYGMLEMGALAFGLTLHDVTPLMWQARLECLTSGNKNVSKRRAIDLFGIQVTKITHNIADALLIAEYGRLMGGQR